MNVMKFGNELEFQIKSRLRRYKWLKGIKLEVKRSELNRDVREAIVRGHYEHAEFEILSTILTGSEKVLELGTCVGFLSTYAAKKCGSKNVISVEANPELIGLIENNYLLNGVSPRLISAIAGLEDGLEVPFYIHEIVYSSSLQPGKNVREITLKTVNVNRLIMEFRPDIIMMDIEGGEIDLLPDLELKGVEYIVVEFHPRRNSDDEIGKAINAMIAKGYHISMAHCKDSIFTFRYLKAQEQ